jgi:hypothetical protein
MTSVCRDSFHQKNNFRSGNLAINNTQAGKMMPVGA